MTTTEPFVLGGRVAYRGVLMTPAAREFADAVRLPQDSYVAGLIDGALEPEWVRARIMERQAQTRLSIVRRAAVEYANAIIRHAATALADWREESWTRCPELPACPECQRPHRPSREGMCGYCHEQVANTFGT
jgi:hypothetical protein